MRPADRAISLVIPVKNTELAKSRLDLSAHRRRALALGMAKHAVLMGTGTVSADRVFVVTDDGKVEGLAHHAGAQVVRDCGRGLNEAAGRGIAAARSHSADGLVVVMVADLPNVSVDALNYFFDKLAGAAGHAVMVTDLSGTGTTMVAVPPGSRLPMVFGRDSAARFAALGCRAMRHAPLSLRADLDTLADLRASFTIAHTAEEPARSEWMTSLEFVNFSSAIMEAV